LIHFYKRNAVTETRKMEGSEDDRAPIVGLLDNSTVTELEAPTRLQFFKKKWLCPLIAVFGVLAISVAIAFTFLKSKTQAGDSASLRIISLNTWGMPHTLGAQDKEIRMEGIGRFIAKKDFDIYLLEELWMRPDHDTIKMHLPDDFHMTEYDTLAPPPCPYDVFMFQTCCDGAMAPGGCSGLTVISRYPILEAEFTVYHEHGPYAGGESLARKGFGRVRIEPAVNMSVDVFLTHTCASDENGWCREAQIKQLVGAVRESAADFVILGGDFNLDPRANETGYHTLKEELVSSMEEFFKHITDWLIPSRASYGNPRNTYSNSYSPVLYDYIWHKANRQNSVWTNIFDVPFLTTVKTSLRMEDESGLFQPREEKISFSDHEAVTASLLLFKSIFS